MMIGRAAQGRPWIFREISHYLADRRALAAARSRGNSPRADRHLHDLYAFYGEHTGVRIARKHISWYTKGLAGSGCFPPRNESVAKHRAEQIAAVDEFFSQLAGHGRQLSYVEARSWQHDNQRKRNGPLRAQGRWTVISRIWMAKRPCGVYDMVITLRRKAAARSVLHRAGGNQTRRRELLGINRNTLRKKMKAHGIKL